MGQALAHQPTQPLLQADNLPEGREEGSLLGDFDFDDVPTLHDVVLLDFDFEPVPDQERRQH